MPRVVADQEELQRIAQNLLMAKLLLEGDLLVNLVTHPLRNSLIEIQLLDLIFQVDQLQRDCLQVQQNLFGVEATLTQNHNFLSADLTKAIGTIAATALGAVATSATSQPQPSFNSFTSNHIRALAVSLQMTSSGENPRVRIDLNQSQGYRQFTVYIPGIQNLALPNQNPLDLASSSAEFAGRRNSAEQAVRLAMQQSEVGSRPTDRVILVGHSLGGMIASNLARDKHFRVNAVVTFGSPNDQIDIPKQIPVLNVNHTDDPVTWLDGVQSSGLRLGTQVQFDYSQASSNISSDAAIPSHDLARYVETSKQIDFDQSSKLDPIKEALRSALGDGKIETRYFEISR